MRFGTWKVRSLYRLGCLKTAARELGRCKLDLVGAQVRVKSIACFRSVSRDVMKLLLRV
jgi:hypothetical protein